MSLYERVCSLSALVRSRRELVRLRSGRGLLLLHSASPSPAGGAGGGAAAGGGSVVAIDHMCYHHGGPLFDGDIEEVHGVQWRVVPFPRSRALAVFLRRSPPGASKPLRPRLRSPSEAAARETFLQYLLPVAQVPHFDVVGRMLVHWHQHCNQGAVFEEQGRQTARALRQN